MTPDQSPFAPAWMGVDLPRYRPCDGTYCFFNYDGLPPLNESVLTGGFHWLPPLEPRLQAIVDIHRQTPPDQLALQLEKLTATATELGLTLPPAFLAFMADAQRRDQIPSCTACYFDLPDVIVKSPVSDGYLIRFMNDQQDVLVWYLYLTPSGDHGVMVSNIIYDTVDMNTIPAEVVQRATALCAPSFEAFLYRWWLENTIWFAADENRALTDAQQRYVAHYTPPA